MINGVRLKICGLRRESDARVAADLGADYLAFNLYKKSPRYLAPKDYEALAPALPAGLARVAVMVEPSLEDLEQARLAGFAYFQIHARHDVGSELVCAWSRAVGADALWLAPKLPPGGLFPEAWLESANTFLVDTYHAAGFGGSGKTGDWAGFARLAAKHRGKAWVLAGGLSPENIAMALEQSGARFVDVNSGVEDAPGVKSSEKLRALARALAAGSRPSSG